jgi:hypothetical protein
LLKRELFLLLGLKIDAAPKTSKKAKYTARWAKHTQ